MLSNLFDSPMYYLKYQLGKKSCSGAPGVYWDIWDLTLLVGTVTVAEASDSEFPVHIN